jgi:predicted nucleic-acid-binding protein
MRSGAMRAVDTNLLVRLVARDEPRQVAAAESFVARGAWVSHIVLVDAVWVLESVYELDRSARGRAVAMLLNHRDLTVQDADVVAAALNRFTAKSGVSFSDCLVLEVARKAGHVPLGTFDRELGKLDGAERLLGPRDGRSSGCT